jgi:D-alanyl-D-alanine carboxypeptidase (penicillin-binding protein 5/6)
MVLTTSISYGDNLSLSAVSGILIDGNSGRILYEKNSHEKMPMASTTKIMTALVAIENGKLEDKVNIKKTGVGIEGSSIYLRDGEIISLRDLLYGLMLRSGNDAAVSIADHVGQGVDNFIDLMNKKAEEVGAVNTNFMNPHGLPNDNHYTTAYDLALITREALKHEEFKDIVKAKTWTAKRDENNYFYNKNQTLWEYEGGDGVKTGYTMRAGRCLVSSATRKGMQLIAVVLNAGDWFNDNYKLLNYGFEKYTSYIIYDKNQYMTKVPIVNGKKEYVFLVAENSLTYPLKEGEKSKVKISIDNPTILEAPIEKGEVLGSIQTYLDGQLIRKDNLIVKESIDKISFIDKIINMFKNS